jgi:hypothetical protein
MVRSKSAGGGEKGADLSGILVPGAALDPRGHIDNRST